MTHVRRIESDTETREWSPPRLVGGPHLTRYRIEPLPRAGTRLLCGTCRRYVPVPVEFHYIIPLGVLIACAREHEDRYHGGVEAGALAGDAP